MARHKDANWALLDKITTWDEAIVSVLMDIRDELKELNSRTNQNTLTIQNQERAINRLDRRLQKHLPLAKKRRKR